MMAASVSAADGVRGVEKNVYIPGIPHQHEALWSRVLSDAKADHLL